jgi:hypothetical protein
MEKTFKDIRKVMSEKTSASGKTQIPAGFGEDTTSPAAEEVGSLF